MAKDPAVLFYTSDFISGTITMTDEQRGKYIMLLCIQHQKGYLTEKDMLNISGVYDADIWEKFVKEGDVYYNVRMREESEKRAKYTESRRSNRLKGDNENVCIYLMIDNISNHIKIGSSNNPERRLQEIRSQLNNSQIDLIAFTKPTSQKIESEIHAKYKLKNVGFEWFDLSEDDILNIIKSYDMINHMISHMENENENIEINKEGVKGEKTEPISTTVEQSLSNRSVYPFDDFWNDYEKKVGDKEKIRRKYDKLPDKVRLAIKEHIPKYKAAQPEKQFRKNPETYLNNKGWNDEIIAKVQIKTNYVEPYTNDKWKD